MNTAARLASQSVVSRSWVVSVFLQKAQLTLLVMIVSTLLSALGVVYITNNARTLNANIQQALAEREKLQVQWGQLLLEKSTWIMQARIQNLAEGELGMMIPDSKSVVVVSE